jgi:uncharacterized membrane protein
MTDETKDQATDQTGDETSEATPAAADDAMTGVVAAEVDPHGATVVAVVGDETGVQAVAVLETDYFNTVLAAEFANPDAAKAAYMALRSAEIDGALRIDGVLAVHADGAGKIHVDKMTDHSTKTGLKWGAVGGLVLGIVFPPAIIASTIGWGVIGSALGKMRNIYHQDKVAKELEGAIGPNNSGIIALVHATQVAQVKAQIPEATKVTTAEVDEATAKEITDEAKEASKTEG